MNRILAILFILGGLMLVLGAPSAEAGGKRKKDKDTVKVKIAWNMGSDRRGEVHVHGCSAPLRNSKSPGACFEKDILDEPLINFIGEFRLRLREGRKYTVCFVADDTVGRPGRWGACKVLPAIDGALYRFSVDDLLFWGGGRWIEP